MVAIVGLIIVAVATGQASAEWSLEQAALPYRGTELNAIFLDRPSY